MKFTLYSIIVLLGGWWFYAKLGVRGRGALRMLRLSGNGRADDNLGLFIHNGAADYSRVIFLSAERPHRTKEHEQKRAMRKAQLSVAPRPAGLGD